jgi:hypothetical protein
MARGPAFLETAIDGKPQGEKQMTIQTTIRRFVRFGGALCVSALLTASVALGQSADDTSQAIAGETQTASWWRPSPEPKISFRPVIVFGGSEVIPAAGSILVRNRDNVFATMHTTGLTPGTVISLWWTIFNNPHNCATRPCTPADLAISSVEGSVISAGGKLIGADGAATFGAFRTVGDTTGVFTGLGTGRGLLDPLRAEIHLVARTHGPALNDPMLFGQQLTLFNGGCPPNTCVNRQASIHQP